MKSLFLLVLIVFSAVSAKAKPWLSFQGCYDTSFVEGLSVVPSSVPSRITDGSDPLFVNLDNSSIRSLVMTIMVSDNGRDTLLALPTAFIGAPGATVTDHGRSLVFGFAGEVKIKSSGKKTYMSYETHLSRTNQWVTIYSNGHQIKLKKVDCPY